jgi:nitronate monooxygenase
MMITTALTQKLAITHPILLAPMDLVSDAKLTAAVSAAGGFGILGGGYGDETWLRTQLDVLADSRERFGVGFITWSLARAPHLLDIALERLPAAVMLSFGAAAPFIDCAHRAGALAICQVQSLEMATTAVAAGADILVVQGTEAAGHGATRGLTTLLPEVVDAIGSGVPVVAAGGIADGRGLAASLMLGASGVLMGTRFYASREAAGAEAAKQRIVEAEGDGTVRGMVFDITRQRHWPAPFTGRCLRNAHTERWSGRETELMHRVDEIARTYDDAQHRGDYDTLAVIAGEAVGLVHEIATARDIVQRVVDEATALLRGAARHVEAAAR